MDFDTESTATTANSENNNTATHGGNLIIQEVEEEVEDSRTKVEVPTEEPNSMQSDVIQ